jgi:quercetin dioxygenase-like cupin family protein
MASDDGFEVRLVAVAPGGSLAYHDAEWRDALVVVERGEIELESLSGSLRSFERGDVLWLAGLPLRALHNRGHQPAVLVAVSRRDEFSAAAGSYLRPPPRGDRDR